jgi:succinyl-diaminopimelate desuccinylase
MNTLDIAKALIAAESITPHVGKAFDVLEGYLKPLGFEVQRVVFNDDDHPTENLYARLGATAPNLCFAGHLDVVPPGDWSRWTYPPFEPTVANGILYGRGTEDMKGAIAAFVAAVSAYVVQSDDAQTGSISFLITGDEEGIAITGTEKMLGWLADKGEKLDACIVGEPTNPHALGEMIKVGRRGSINATIIAQGKQGHVAYPHLADNPVTRLVNTLNEMQNYLLDEGTEFFPPSNLQVTTVDVNNDTTNLIPATAQGRLNIRFNDQHSGESLEKWLADVCDRHIGKGAYTLDCRVSGEAFLTRDDALTNAMLQAVEQVTGQTPKLSTTGGTSDARFIKNVCPVIEFGTTGETAHMIDECVKVETLEGLSDIYLAFLKGYLLA